MNIPMLLSAAELLRSTRLHKAIMLADSAATTMEEYRRSSGVQQLKNYVHDLTQAIKSVEEVESEIKELQAAQRETKARS